ncbi:MAG: hypothetical protein LBR51_04455 [Bacteroidales bacterium]|jgi:hypothetical protein|nr:hypothetical protein [Bacteroidales bacterium]
MKITASTVQVKVSDREIFSRISNCNHFGEALSSRVSGWSSTEDSCSGEVPGVGHISLNIKEKIPSSKVVFQVVNSQNMPVLLTIDIVPLEEAKSELLVVIDVEVPFFLAGLIKKPLQQFADTLADNIKSQAEKMTIS